MRKLALGVVNSVEENGEECVNLHVFCDPSVTSTASLHCACTRRQLVICHDGTLHG